MIQNNYVFKKHNFLFLRAETFIFFLLSNIFLYFFVIRNIFFNTLIFNKFLKIIKSSVWVI